LSQTADFNLEFYFKTFDQVNTIELYNLLRLRSEVFVVEQDCVYQDIDNKDQSAIHLLGKLDDTVVAYARLFSPGDYFKEASIGRVVVNSKYRKLNYGKAMMRAAIKYIQKKNQLPIKISAQCYLDGFYSDLGFVKIGVEYLEDGIPHQAMILK
jgi:ElaA protein